MGRPPDSWRIRAAVLDFGRTTTISQHGALNIRGIEASYRAAPTRGRRGVLQHTKVPGNESPAEATPSLGLGHIALLEGDDPEGSYHQLSTKHLPAYLDEVAFKFNNRENAYLFRDTMPRPIGEEPLRYRTLVHG